MKTRICLFIAILLSSLSVGAQDAREELIKMGKRYREAKSFSMEVSMKTYESRFDEKPSVSSQGTVKKSKGRYYTQMMDKISLYNDHCSLIIDEGQKLMVYSKPLKDNNQADVAAVLDSTLFRNNKVNVKSDKDGKKVLEIFPKGTVYESIEVTINSTDHFLEKVVYVYRESAAFAYGKIEISYSKVKFNTSIPESFFSEKGFIEKKGGQLVAAGHRAGYKVIDKTTIKHSGNE